MYKCFIVTINLELIFAQQIQRTENSGNTIKEVWNIDTNLYTEELDTNGNKILVQICLQVVNLQQKSFWNKGTNAVMRKFTRASIISPSNLKHYNISKALNQRLINADGSDLC